MFEGNQEKISQETYIEEVKNWEDNKRGCPDEIKCKRNCRHRGLPYLDGVCIGPHKKHCHCLNCSITHDKDDSASKHGCPNLAVCINHCKMSGHNTGACIGPKRLTCDCSSIKTAEDAPAFKSSLLSPNTVRGGCPVASFCSVFCNSRGFKKGLCLGPRKEYCNCYERISSSLRGPAIDEVNKKKNKDDNGKRQVQGIKKFVSPPEPKKEVRTQEPKKKVGVSESGSCPDVGKCVTTCQAKGNTVGFCTGEGRRECKCVK